MTKHMKAQSEAVSGWEDEGGAAPSAAQRTTETVREQRDHSAVEGERLDASHASATRGEHRYPDAHQTKAEQQSRRTRDDLKRRLAGPAK